MKTFYKIVDNKAQVGSGTLRKCKCGTIATCVEELELFELRTKSKFGRSNRCKECSNAKSKVVRVNGKSKTKEQYRKADLKKSYGITLEEYDKMFQEQGFVCKICNRPKPEGAQNFHVDHCHTTGAIRGILCPSCNHLLGNARDNIEVLDNAIKYLKGSNTNADIL